VALASVFGLVAVACPSDGSPESLPSERPPPAGTIRIAYPEEPATLNPVTEPSPAARDILRAVLPSFFVVGPDLTYRLSLLAEDPEVRTEGDRMTVRFRIREGALWSDGEPITVDDVAFTWRVMTESALEVTDPQGFDHVVDVVEISPTEGELVLSPPLASWRDLFAAGRFVLPGHTVSEPAAVGEWDEGPPVGAGPFLLERWERGRAVVLAADPTAAGPDPLAERIEVTFVPDPTTAIQLLEAGLLDAVAPMLGVSWSRRLAAVPGVRISEAYGPDLMHLVMNAQTLESADTRRRIAEAIDRHRFVDAVVNEEGREAHGVLSPEQTGAASAWSEYGTGTAGSLAGQGELDLVYARGELIEFLARYVQAQLERAGGDVELVPLEPDVFRGTFLPARRFDLALVEVRSGPSPDLARYVEAPGGTPALTALQDPRLSSLIESVDRGDQGALADAQERLAELVPVLPLFQPQAAVASTKGVVGLEANPTVDGPLWNAAQWTKPA
jgi:ABC-type transport system substrate-binding protein